MNQREKDSCDRFTGLRLRGLRERRKISITEVARKAGMYPTNLNRIEQGRRGVSFYTLLCILRAMRSSLKDFSNMRDPRGKRGTGVYGFRHLTTWEKKDE